MRTTWREDDLDPRERGRHIIGVDLAQASDFTAACVLRSTPEPGRTTATGDEGFRLDCVALKRYERGLAYPAIVRDISALLHRPEILRDPSATRYRPESGLYEDPLLVIDATGVGRAVVDLFLESDLGAADVLACTITSGVESREDSWNGTAARHARVPKIALVGVVQAGLSTGRLKFAPGLELADAVKREMLNFKVKVNLSTGHESFEAWRENIHDDLILSVAIAAWAAARPTPQAVWGGDPLGDDWW